MISLIRTLLREQLLEAEFDKGGHSIERIKQRINAIPDTDLAFDIKEMVFYNLDRIKNTDFSPNKDFAIMLGKFRPDPKSSFYLTDEQGRGYYRVNTNEPNSVIKDSTGDEFWMIIRKNVIQTFFLRKGWQTKDHALNAEKLRVDFAFKDVNQAITSLGKKKENSTSAINKPNRPFVNINGVIWVVDKDNQTVFKKNKPTEIRKIDDILNQLDEPTQSKILELL